MQRRQDTGDTAGQVPDHRPDPLGAPPPQGAGLYNWTQACPCLPAAPELTPGRSPRRWETGREAGSLTAKPQVVLRELP